MGKSSKALKTAKEVAHILEEPVHVLYFWAEKFPWISPVMQSNRKYYRPDDVKFFKIIQRLIREEGLTTKGAQKVIRTTNKKELFRKWLSDDTSSINHLNVPEKSETVLFSDLPQEGSADDRQQSLPLEIEKDTISLPFRQQYALKEILYELIDAQQLLRESKIRLDFE